MHIGSQTSDTCEVSPYQQKTINKITTADHESLIASNSGPFDSSVFPARDPNA